MYLKALEINGFKSFARKQKLDFERGITAVVGPNGCGKSNISDAVRWVLGEQSAKALRGSKMEDVIFNGTDTRKPVGMAEVSITFADAEKDLGVGYNEVMVTRRVLRSGEGQYFLNKTPCRLKDIQRLFMDTGIGTDSYSVMEQGRIDKVLSARPEDRRAVFEEASGITRFKMDKREALRKLDQTEANLLRLADVIREVKRQIGSLQRQAGKARRYKDFMVDLKKLDLFLTREKMNASSSELSKLEVEINSLAKKVTSEQAEIHKAEADNASLRESLVRTEREIGSIQETCVQAQSKLDHTHEMIRLHRQRIEEYQRMEERDSSEIEDFKRQIDSRKTQEADLARLLTKTSEESKKADDALAVCLDRFNSSRVQLDALRTTVQKLRQEAVDTEGTSSRLQNELTEIETRERANDIRRERLTAERSHIERSVDAYQKRNQEMAAALEGLASKSEQANQKMESLSTERDGASERLTELRRQLGEVESLISAENARIDMLKEKSSEIDALPSGTRAVLEGAAEGIDNSAIMGTLASSVEVEPNYQKAFESAARAWLDTVLVRNASDALSIIRAAQTGSLGAIRLLAPLTQQIQAPQMNGLDALISHVKADGEALAVLQSIIPGIAVINDIDSAPSPMPAGVTCVTRDGALISPAGAFEIWTGEAATNPFTLKHTLSDCEAKIANLEAQRTQTASEIETLSMRLKEMSAEMAAAQASSAEHSRALALKEGEAQVLKKELEEAKAKFDTVSFEVETLQKEGQSGDESKSSIAARLSEIRKRRDAITLEVAQNTESLHKLENKNSEINSELTDRKVEAASLSQRLEHVSSQHEQVAISLREIENAVQGRSRGIAAYVESREKLTTEIERSTAMLADLEKSVETNTAKVEGLRLNRDKQQKELSQMEVALSTRRDELDSIRSRKSDLDVKQAESKMRRQNMLDRVLSDYSVTLEDISNEPEPEWDESGRPSMDAVETMVAEIKTKLDAMGPVNLVAIEEYSELEERFAFLTEQEQDLINSKQHLMDLIRKINRTTSEMFKATFEQANIHFGEMFKRLFNGGTAKLVLVNEEDILECGIEIIARPPGKRLQNVSLLSGGERTMTAVALLFAIYMIKPSAFCLLDELDAALDDANIGRFVSILTDFVKMSQFLVITHNKQTIGAASTIYGVTMPERGVSELVSMKFREYENNESEMTGPVVR